MKILIAWDAQPDARPLAEWVRAWNRQLRAPAHITLMHVVPITAAGGLGVQEQAARLDMEEAQRALRAWQADAALEAEVKLVAGAPGPLLCAEAAQHDMLVIGSHGRSQMSELLWGTTGAYVLHHAPCPVLVVRQDARLPLED